MIVLNLPIYLNQFSNNFSKVIQPLAFTVDFERNWDCSGLTVILVWFVSQSLALTDLNGEARWQPQRDEVPQLGEQSVGDGHEVDDGHHLFCQGQRMGLTQPQLGFKPGNTEGRDNDSLLTNVACF